MARNEAKVKFTADTRELTSQIQSANGAMKLLNSTMKLAQAEFRNSGDQAEFLKNKQKILQAELEANRIKQEALSGKVEAAKAIYGENSAEVQNWTTKLNQAKTEQQNLQTQLDQCTQEIEDQAKAEQQARTPLEQLNTKISEQKAELEQLKTEYKNVALEQGTGSQEAQALKAKIDDLNGELEQNESKLREVDSALEEAGRDADASANGGWTVLNGVIADLAANAIQNAIDKIKEFTKSVVDSGIDFSSSMSNVQALSGATSEEMDRLEQTARQLGSSTIYSATDVSDAFGYMALAGWDVDEMLQGVDGVLNLAAASNMDLAKASDIVTDYLTAFGLSAEDAGGFVDQMAYAMSHSNTDVTQLGEAYKNVAATAGSLGYSVEDTTAVLMTMADAGVKGGEAGTGLSAIMTRLATDTKSCASQLEEYGVHVYDEQGNMNDLASILEGVRGVWNGLSTEEQAALAKTIAGQSHYSQFATIMQGLQEGTDGASSSFRENTDALEEVKNASKEGTSAAQEMADTMQDNLGGDLKSLGSAIDELKLKIFDGIEQPARNIVQFITNNVIPAATQVLQFIQQHSTAFGILAGVIGIIVTAMLLQNAVQAVQAAMNAAEAASLAPLIAAKLSAAAASWAALAPYILIVAAIAAVIAIIVLCVLHWDQIKQKVIEVATTVRTTVTQAWNNLMTSLSSIMDGIRSTISNIWNNIQSRVSSIVNSIRSTVSSVFNGIKSTASSIWNAIKDNIINPIKDAYDDVTQKISDLKSKIEEKINDIKSKVQETFDSIREKMEHPIQTAKDTIDGIIGTIKGWFPLSLGRIIDNIELPHFSLEGSFSINPPSVPHISVSWWASGAVFDAPTLIPTINGVHGVGEAGPEAVSPVSVLQDYIGAAVQRFVPHIDYDLLGQKVASACAKLGITIEMDKRQLGRVVREVV